MTPITISVLILLPAVGIVSLLHMQDTEAEGPASSAAATPPLDGELGRIQEQGRALVESGHLASASIMFERGYLEALNLGDHTAALRCLTSLANIEFKLFRHRKAMETYLEARRLAESSEDREMVSVLSTNISSLYLAVGGIEEADHAAQEALDALPADYLSKYLPGILAHRATVYAFRDDMARAVPLFHQALAEADRWDDSVTQARIWDQLGYEHLRRNDLSSAEAALVEAFRLTKMNGREAPAQLYLDLASLRLAQGDLASASRFMEEAFVAAQVSGSRLPVWSLHYRRAQLHEAQGQVWKALADAETALRYIRDWRLELLPSDSVRTSAGVGLQRVYAFYVDLASRLYFLTGRPDLARRAFEAAEENRAVGLRETAGESEEIRRRLSPEYWELLGQLVAAETSLFRKDSRPAGRGVERLRHRLFELELQAGLQLAGTRGPVTGAITPPSLAAVQRALRPMEVLFSFFVGDGDSYLWAVTVDHLELYRLPGRGCLEAQAAAFHSAVRNSLPQAANLGEVLYRTLFGSVNPELLRRPNWVLLLDGPLFELPFAALVADCEDGSPVFLVERHSLRILPSAMVLSASPSERWLGPWLGVSDPVYNPADPRRAPPAGAQSSGWTRLPALLRGFWSESESPWLVQLARLPGSARETQRCAEAFDSPAAPPVLLTGRSASLHDFRAALEKQPSVVHFATHVVPSPEQPHAGLIALSLRPGGEPEFLSSAAVSALRVNAGLVVMSGCSSGSGEALPGEGLWGLTRAWLRAGAHNVAATLWPTPDDSGELLRSLYRYLGPVCAGSFSRSPDLALQMAQVDMLRSQTWRSSPSYWAAYFSVGKN